MEGFWKGFGRVLEGFWKGLVRTQERRYQVPAVMSYCGIKGKLLYNGDDDQKPKQLREELTAYQLWKRRQQQ